MFKILIEDLFLQKQRLYIKYNYLNFLNIGYFFIFSKQRFIKFDIKFLNKKKRAGKKFTIKGGEQNEKGILTRAVDDMIKLSDLSSQSLGTKITQKNKPVTVVFSIFSIYNNEVVDLLQRDRNEDELEEVELTLSEDFRRSFMKSRDRLKTIGSGEQSIRRLHIIYKFSIYRNLTGKSKGKVYNGPNGGLFSTITFVHCADFCKAKLPEFIILGDYLADIATLKDSNTMEVPAYANSNLISYISDSLNSGRDNNCVLICNISGSYDYLSQSVDCLQFCAGIKEKIDNYLEDVNEFNQDNDIINQLTSPYNKPQSQLKQGSNSYQKLNNQNTFGQGEGGSFRNSKEGFNQQGDFIHVLQRDSALQFRKQRGENPTANEIQNDLNSLIKDIYSFTDQTHGLSEEELKDWAVDRENELKSIQNDISKLSPEEQRQFDDTLYKAQVSHQFLQQIQKNALQLSQNRSPTSGGLRKVENFGQMMNTQNKSRYSLMKQPQSSEELIRSQNQSQIEQQQSYQQPLLQEGVNSNYSYQNNKGGKKNSIELKEQILNKIEEVINENDASRGAIHYSGNGGDFNNERSSRNLRELKEMLADQDYLLQEKRKRLKKKNKELMEQQVELKNQLQYLESDFQEQDAKIKYLEAQKQQLQEQIERDRDIIQLKISKEELLEKNDEELRELIERFKIKLSRRKQECSVLKENIDRFERDVYTERSNFGQERNVLAKQVDEISTLYENERIRNQDLERINESQNYQTQEQERIIQKLQEDLDIANKRYDNFQMMYSEEQTLNKDLRINLQVNEKRVDDAENRAQVLEVKYNKLKRKCYEEKNIIVGEKDQEIIKKKEATTRLKIQIKEFEKRVQELTQDSKASKIENQQLKTFNEELQKENIEKNRQVQDLTEELENVSQELKRVRNIQRENAQYSNNDQIEKKKLFEENERLTLNLRKQEKINVQLENELDAKTNQIEQIKKDFIMIDEENNGQKNFINQLERQNKYLSDVQQTDIDKLENKIKELHQEINILRKENKELKINTNEQSIHLIEFKNANDRQNEKLSKNKHIISHLTQQLDQMDEKVKELINEKNLEISQVQSQSIQHPINNAQRNQVKDNIQKSDHANNNNSLNQQQRSILKKPRFNLADSDSDVSYDSNV